MNTAKLIWLIPDANGAQFGGIQGI